MFLIQQTLWESYSHPEGLTAAQLSQLCAEDKAAVSRSLASLAEKGYIESDEKKLDKKTSYLCAVAAATAAGGEHCVRVQGTHAKEAGASKEEILEAIVIGSYMSMTRAQSYAFRIYQDLFKE